MRSLNLFALFSLLVLQAAPVFAVSVSLRNGNAYVAFRDAEYPGGYNLRVDRVYNSKTAYEGIFGHGWGHDFAVHLKIESDGSVIVHEYGSGAVNRYEPSNYSQADMEKSVEDIVKAAQKAGYFTSGAQMKTLKEELLKDPFRRTEVWGQLVREKRLNPKIIPTGTKLISSRVGYQYIMTSASGYTRISEGGKTESFDKLGKLVKVLNQDGSFIVLTYSKSGLVEKIQDNINRKLYFSYNNKGKVASIAGESKKVAEYKYNDANELIYAKGFDGEPFQYEYTKDGYHNLTKIGYKDKTFDQISYYGNDLNMNVKTNKDREGTVSEYKYSKIPGETLKNLKVEVKMISPGMSMPLLAIYEYVFKSKPSGDEWIFKYANTMDGTKTETIYDEKSNLPLKIARGENSVSFEYDAKSRVKKREDSRRVTLVSYDERAGKISKVKISLKGKGNHSVEEYDYQYDPKGNMTLAKDMKQRSAKLIYDAESRPKTILYGAKRRVDLQYNEASRPVTVRDSIGVTTQYQYNAAGELISTDRKPASTKITEGPFDLLTDLVAPAEIKLQL